MSKLKQKFEELHDKMRLMGIEGIDLSEGAQYMQFKLDNENNAGFLIGAMSMAAILKEGSVEKYFETTDGSLLNPDFAQRVKEGSSTFELRIPISDLNLEKLDKAVSFARGQANGDVASVDSGLAALQEDKPHI